MITNTRTDGVLVCASKTWADLSFVGEEFHRSLRSYVEVAVLAQRAGQPAEREGLARHRNAHVHA